VNESDSDRPLLEMRGVSKSFGPTVALGSVDLTLRAGQILALVGENGAGKSTLMKVLSGAHRPDAGRMTLSGEPFRPANPWAARRAGVGMIYQELSIAPDLSVMENVLLGVEPGRRWLAGLRGVNWREARRRAGQALREVGREDIDPDARAGDLPLAERQLIEVARAVALGCRVLVLDEPTSSLTRTDIDRLFAMLRRLKTQGLGVIYISHFLEEVREIADRFLVLRDGESVGEGDPAPTRDEAIIRMMVGREVDDLYPRTTRRPGGTVLELTELAGLRRPRRATLSLRRGEVLGVAGLVGAGRTEMLRAIFGLDPVRDGRVKVAGVAGPASPRRRWRQGVGFLSEDRNREGLALNLSLADNLTLPRLNGLGPCGLIRPGRQDRAAQLWIARIGIKSRSPRQAVGDLSGGNQQKVALGRLLHHDADVLLLDEPTRGVDIGAKAQIFKLINDLAAGEPHKKRRPRAVLMVSSYLPELLGVCDRVAVMSRGFLGEARPVEAWTEASLMEAAIGAGEPNGGRDERPAE